MDTVSLNKVFHDHECSYYDERFAIAHDEADARAALADVESALGRDLATDHVVLDVGCGTGWFAAGLERLAPETVVLGLDLSSGMLSKAAGAGASRLIQAQCEAVPLPDSCADVVVSRGVLHHVPDPGAALAEWRRLVKPDGAVLLASEPTPAVDRAGAVLVRHLLAMPGLRGGLSEEQEFWEMAAMAANLHTFTKPELVEMCVAAGFTRVSLAATGFSQTLVMTASYVLHGHAPSAAGRVPWRRLISFAASADTLLDRAIPERWRHTVAGVIRP